MRPIVASAFALALAACSSGPAEPVTEAGALEEGDTTLGTGELYDAYTTYAREGQWIRVSVQAQGFDPYLIVRSPSEAQSEVDDSEEGDETQVSIDVRADASGRWTTMVTSFAPGETGAYTVTTHVTDEPPPGATAAPSVDPSTETVES